MIEHGIIFDDLMEQNELVPMQQGKEEDGDELNHGELTYESSQDVEKCDSLSMVDRLQLPICH